MNINRLPTSYKETSHLLGAYDAENNRVVWAIDGQAFYTSDMFIDGTNWFVVWRVGNVIHCQAAQWHSPSGDFCLFLTDVTPDQAVATASRAATAAWDYMCENIKL